MYMRFLHIKAKETDPDIIRSFYESVVIPELQIITGCLYAALIQNNKDHNDHISLTLWDSKINAEKYEKSGVFKKLIEQIQPFLAESSEWKIQLSEDLQLQYSPVIEEPQIEEFLVTSKGILHSNIKSDHSIGILLRLVSVKLEENKIDEFRRIYKREILPVLQNTKGCSYAYLVESLHEKNEVVSITIWDNKKNADEYESSGNFRELVSKLKHTFSKFYQWKMSLEKGFSGDVKSSEDLKLSEYNMVSGRSFES